MFTWLPLGIFIFNITYTSSTILPINISHIVNSLTGPKTTVSKPKASVLSSTKNYKRTRGVLYICNHRTLLDPIFVSYSVMKPIPAVTYSMRRFSEVSSRVKFVCLEISGEGQEGPYLLRFSPHFAEITDEIVPAAIDMQVNIFYGSTASGIKCLDPLFNLLNPSPLYCVKILEQIPSSQTCKAGGKPRTDVANHVQ
ncbi:hypothetical protein ACOSP7_009990 [Xanthoceras sorbifolium]